MGHNSGVQRTDESHKIEKTGLKHKMQRYVRLRLTKTGNDNSNKANYGQSTRI